MQSSIALAPGYSSASVNEGNSRKQWKGSLSLKFERARPKTVLRRSHNGPLLIQRPFYPEGPVCHAYVLHPPGGIVGGDHLIIDTHCANAAEGLVTTPGATKYYGSDGRQAIQAQKIHVDEGSLEWMPQESIFFDRCKALQQLSINLKSSSRFIGWDIGCFGRPAGEHHFTDGEVISGLDVSIDNKPVLIERLRVNASQNIFNLSGLAGATTCATLLAYGPDVAWDELLTKIKSCLPAGERFAASQLDGLLIVRYLGGSSEAARDGFIEIWKTIRPIVMKRPAVAPRIWST